MFPERMNRITSGFEYCPSPMGRDGHHRCQGGVLYGIRSNPVGDVLASVQSVFSERMNRITSGFE